MGRTREMVYTMINAAAAVSQRHTATTRVGGMRRKTKRVSSTHSAFDDKRFQQTLQKLALQKLAEVEEASILRADGTVCLLTEAQVSVSVQSNTCIINAKALEESPNTVSPSGESDAEVISAGSDEGKEVMDDGKDGVAEEDGDVNPQTGEDSEAPANDSSNNHKPNKAEKKVRKVLCGHGLKPSQGYTEMKVTTKKGITLVMPHPDALLKTSQGVVVACLGKIKMEDVSAAQARKLMEQIRASQPTQSAEDSDSEDCPELDEVTFDQNEVDLGDLDEDDVLLVMNQSSVSRARAIAALKKNSGDVVNAVMALAE